MSPFLTFVALLIGIFAVALAAPYRRWVPQDDAIDQRHMETAAFAMVLLAIALAWCGGRLW